MASKADLEVIFNRLRSTATNKCCFDCSAKNPTWASVTYGVFICIDCSAVHRSLGVHLSFVRSTNLDTNWTWIQIRQMQLGGNANAAQFFRLHNCNTTDAQQKYNSRAAQLYKDKLQNMAQQAMRLHGNTLLIDSTNESLPPANDEKQNDFFADCTNIDNNDFLSNNTINNNDVTKIEKIEDLIQTPATSKSLIDESVNGDAPSVDFLNSTMPDKPIKSTIGVRKIQPKKSGIGSRKGLGATRVKTNFADIEQKATMADQLNEPVQEKKQTEEEEADTIASVRLAYKDLSIKQNKEEERLKSVDPTKAKQMERLGMGFNFNKSGVSHSALTDMQTITQESAPKLSTKNFEKEIPNDLFDDFSTSMFRSIVSMGFETIEPIEPRQKNIQTMFSVTPTSKSSSSISDQPSYSKNSNNRSSSISNANANVNSNDNDNVAQKKFGSAKGISSDQYFGNETSAFERSVNMNRFQGSNSISSSDYFSDGTGTNRSSHKSFDMDMISAPDFDDLKESARQGITKVAGRLSNLANNVVTSIQNSKYGY